MPGFWQQTRLAERTRAFTLVEVLVAMTVLLLLVAMIARIMDGATSLSTQGEGRMDTDTQARALLDRMAVDFSSMVKRTDVDYYLKGRPASNSQLTTNSQPGNDQIAFYAQVPGYFPGTTGASVQSPVSLIAYRVNIKTLRLERLCKGLAWNGASTSTGYTMFFLPFPLASPLPSPLPSPMPGAEPTPVWPQAASSTTADLDYEELGPDVFRFEYYYVLNGQGVNSPSILSDTPWWANHNAVNGLQDVSGIGVVIAVIDPKSRLLVPETQLAALAAQMEDAPYPTTSGTTGATGPADLERQWTNAVLNSGQAQGTGSANPLPQLVLGAIHIYTRCFYLNGAPP